MSTQKVSKQGKRNMIEIIKTKNYHNYYEFYIKTKEGTFVVTFQPNLDLYWNYIPNSSIQSSEVTHDFYITKENYFLYSLISELYESIENKTPYKNLQINPIEEKYHDINKYQLFKNDVIEWHSDDEPYEEGSILYIEKLPETYKITFSKSKETTGIFMTYAVRFRNSGSYYHPYNIPFMIMYNKLKEYDNNYHQIHIEEYLYQKTLKKIK